MGREVRKVPADWQHPRDVRGHFIPLFEGAAYAEMAEESDEAYRVSPDQFMPVWTPEQATHFMMYEDTTEGTPLTPAFATEEELARFCADEGVSAVAGQTATYDQWLAMIKVGSAVSMVIDMGQIRSGVADISHE